MFCCDMCVWSVILIVNTWHMCYPFLCLTHKKTQVSYNSIYKQVFPCNYNIFVVNTLPGIVVTRERRAGNTTYRCSIQRFFTHCSPPWIFFLFRHFCLLTPRAFEIAAFHLWNSFIRGFVFD